MSIAWIGVSVSTFFRAFDEHRQIWDIEHEDDRYTIMRNNVLQFAGSVDDVFAITVDSQIYTIYPKEGRKAYIPRGIFEEGIGNLYHEYRSRKQSEIDSTGASSPIDTPVGSSKTHIKSC